MLFDLFFITKVAGFVEPGVFYFVRKRMLFPKISRIIMCIFLAGSLPQLFCSLIVSILQM